MAAADSLRKFELVRVTPGFVVGIIALAVVNSLDDDPAITTAGNVILAIVLVVLAVLTVGWLRTAGRVRRTAAKSTRPFTVSITDEGLTVARGGAVATKVAWNEVAHCTNAVDVWVFALKGGKDAVLVPHQQFEPADRDQVNAFLSAWPKRRYRYSPWQ